MGIAEKGMNMKKTEKKIENTNLSEAAKKEQGERENRNKESVKTKTTKKKQRKTG